MNARNGNGRHTATPQSTQETQMTQNGSPEQTGPAYTKAVLMALGHYRDQIQEAAKLAAEEKTLDPQIKQAAAKLADLNNQHRNLGLRKSTATSDADVAWGMVLAACDQNGWPVPLKPVIPEDPANTQPQPSAENTQAYQRVTA